MITQRRLPVDHFEVADRAKKNPGHWVVAGNYPSTLSAKSTAHRVPTGSRMPSYRPTAYGVFEARTELADDGTDLLIRFVPATTTAGSA
ncbi:hypothetical protein [Streptomyces sp. NPDC091212]|uniref:hypothetical protein n=1 Tax=Streptomyces sp. NPDC091212 TaxID=3155191 RepID=UPI003440CD92